MSRFVARLAPMAMLTACIVVAAVRPASASLSTALLPGDAIVVPERAPKIGSRNWTPLIQTAQVATSVVLAVAYFKP